MSGAGGAHGAAADVRLGPRRRPFTPMNYRLSAEGIRELIERLPDAVGRRRRAIPRHGHRRGQAGDGLRRVHRRARSTAEPAAEFPDPDDVAVVLFTSGTTSRPKAVELTHNNLTSYVTGTVEFGSAEPDDAALICVPPYHIAGVSAALSNLYAGRKMVYLRQFEPREWVRLVRDEGVTTATVVPTMLDRIVAALEAGTGRTADAAQPRLRRLEGGTSAWCARHSSCCRTSGSSTPTG